MEKHGATPRGYMTAIGEVMQNMEKYRAIPRGYMNVGEMAKKMGVTVRTLQYYDKEGILSPSSESEGGLRLYTHKDIVKMQQIKSMKYLGFSLGEIKTRLPSIETPEEVSNVLTEQARGIREKIESLKDVLESVEKLNGEVTQMKTVNWEKYANLVTVLQNKSEVYWALTHFNDKLSNHIRTIDEEEREKILKAQEKLFQRVKELQENGITPESEEGQIFAKDFWAMIMDFSKGDPAILVELTQITKNTQSGERWLKDYSFIEQAIDCYFQNIGRDHLGQLKVENMEE